MNIFIKISSSMILLFAVSCSSQTQQNHQVIKPVLADNTVVENNGLIATSSPYSVAETSTRLENIIKQKGLTLFTRIDHSANAADVELELNPTQVLIFGNPKVGTPLMQCSATTAIDLPQKILVYQDKNNQTQVVYNDPNYLQQRHNIKGCEPILEKVSGVLNSVVMEAIK